MATLNLNFHALAEHELPAVCAVCGGDATARVLKQFAWIPPLAYLDVATFGPIGLAAIALDRERGAVHVPVCSAHRKHWMWREWGGPALVLVAVVAVAVALVLFSATIPQQASVPTRIASVVTGGILVASVATMIGGLVIYEGAVRADEITPTNIRLTNLHDRFADAVLASPPEYGLIARRRR